MRKTNSKAFTLVETLIMVGVIGIIAIIAIVSLRNMRPDKDYTMIRKAYSEIAKAVATLANDDDLYPVQKTAYKNGEQDKYLTAVLSRMFGLCYKNYNGYASFCDCTNEGLDPAHIHVMDWGICGKGLNVQKCSSGYTKVGNACAKDPLNSSSSSGSSNNNGNPSGSGSGSGTTPTPNNNLCYVGDNLACTQAGGTFNMSTCKCSFPNGFNGDCSELRNKLDNWNANGIMALKLDNLLKNLFPSRKSVLAFVQDYQYERLEEDPTSSCSIPAVPSSSSYSSSSSGNSNLQVIQEACCSARILYDQSASDFAFEGGTCHYLGAGQGWILNCPSGTTKQNCACVKPNSSSSSGSISSGGLTLTPTDGFTDQIWEASGCNDSSVDCSAHPENPACNTGGGKGNDDPCVSNPISCIQDGSVPIENPDDIGTSTPNGDNKNGSADYTLPNFQAGSRGNVFTNTNFLPANHPSDMKTTNKFAYSFASLFDTKSRSCNDTSCSFVTKDGMSWTIEDNFTKSSKDAIITVDINGNRGPNSRTSGNIDRFRFRVDAGGAINVYGQDNEASVQKALKALTSRKFRKED